MHSQLTTTKRRLYRLTFHGRKVGAIGIMHPVQIDVPADSEREARELAYETHEHIWGGLDRINVELVAHACPNCEQWQYVGGDCYNECVRHGFAQREASNG